MAVNNDRICAVSSAQINPVTGALEDQAISVRADEESLDILSSKHSK